MLNQSATVTLPKDQELIEAYKRGCEQAGEELFLRYYSVVSQFCCQRLGSWDDAKDAAQTVFIKVLVEKKIFQFRGQAHLKTWLLRIAINICNGCYHKKQRLREVRLLSCPAAGELLPAQAKGLNPEEQISKKETLACLHQVVDQLPRKYKKAITSTYLADRSYKEAARNLGISLPTLGVHIMRGKQLLERLIAKSLLAEIKAVLPFWANEANAC